MIPSVFEQLCVSVPRDLAEQLGFFEHISKPLSSRLREKLPEWKFKALQDLRAKADFPRWIGFFCVSDYPVVTDGVHFLVSDSTADWRNHVGRMADSDTRVLLCEAELALDAEVRPLASGDPTVVKLLSHIVSSSVYAIFSSIANGQRVAGSVIDALPSHMLVHDMAGEMTFIGPLVPSLWFLRWAHFPVDLPEFDEQKAVSISASYKKRVGVA